MIPIVGVATGAIGAIHSQLTTPIMILVKEASGLIQFVIDACVDFTSVLFNLQRKNWGLAMDSLLNAFKANGTYSTFFSHILSLTKLLKRINNILDEVKQYPDLADDVIAKLNNNKTVLKYIKKLDSPGFHNSLKQILNVGNILTKSFAK